MQKVVFFTNIPSPYRVDFFNELGKYCDLTVCYERRTATNRNQNWVGDSAQNYEEVYLELKPHGSDSGKGNGIAKYIKAHPADIVIFSGYSSPAIVHGITYCRLHRVRYFIEYDGGFNKKDVFYKRLLKKFLIRGAAGHFITCDQLRQYLCGFGISDEKLLFYPFSSLMARDILPTLPTEEEKKAFREAHGIAEARMVLSVGQFIHRKGFDILLEAVSDIREDVGIYIVGGTPTTEYLALQESLNTERVHFVDFMSKSELRKWYRAADLFAFPTREDIWGLVINEAMACGLPVVSTDRCVAALEMIKDGENGYIVPAEDAEALAERINAIVGEDEKRRSMGACSLQYVANYTIENMVQTHVEKLALR